MELYNSFPLEEDFTIIIPTYLLYTNMIQHSHIVRSFVRTKI